MNILFNPLHYVLPAILFAYSAANAQKAADKFRYTITAVGSPSNPDTRYDDSPMKALQDLGFNSLQLNVAWGTRPKDEPLNRCLIS